MPLDALNAIAQAEHAAERIEADAAAAAKQRIADAKRFGEESLKAARRNAEIELEKSREELELHGKEDSITRARQTDEEKEHLRERAGQRLDSAAQLIVERIVSG